jgi:hypothetical protein
MADQAVSLPPLTTIAEGDCVVVEDVDFQINSKTVDSRPQLTLDGITLTAGMNFITVGDRKFFMPVMEIVPGERLEIRRKSDNSVCGHRVPMAQRIYKKQDNKKGFSGLDYTHPDGREFTLNVECSIEQVEWLESPSNDNRNTA